MRLVYDRTRQTHVVLHPEGALVPNGTAVSVLELCDGTTTVPQIAAALGARYAGVREAEVGAVLERLTELTHRCPLHCAYCPVPLELMVREEELRKGAVGGGVHPGARARRAPGAPVRRRAAGRPDLPGLVSHVSGLGCYVNLVTSGLGLTEGRLADLAGRGLDNVQLSVQGAHARTVAAGGLAEVLRRCAAARGLTLRVEEAALPVRYEARPALAARGLAPLDAACAGCLCLFVPPQHTARVLDALRAHPYGRHAALVGEVTADAPGDVEYLTPDGHAHTRATPSGSVPERLL